ncbi:MAG: hypothetical protein Q8N88_03600 [Nanoarchaeota archaeon]|nr:hypothetical protein [Nanoarchaeota archaeon]
MEFDELQDMSAMAVKKDFEKNGFGVDVDLIVESLIKALYNFGGSDEEMKNQITGMTMLFFAVADNYKFDLQDALLTRIEGMNREK